MISWQSFVADTVLIWKISLDKKIFLDSGVTVKKSESTYQRHPTVPRLLLVIFPQSNMIIPFLLACMGIY